mmetsp:Transcript_54783/g.127546  ORF Transcript_54783/g.127546 Transcript_54783/m.127546 type:complete len:204 (-) Transcript_54783:178-789(-)
MKRVMVTRLETAESKMLAKRGMMVNFSFMMKSTGCSSREISPLERPTDIRMPIIMLRTMFQFSWPKCTASPFFGPRRRWRRRWRAPVLLTMFPERVLVGEVLDDEVAPWTLGRWTSAGGSRSREVSAPGSSLEGPKAASPDTLIEPAEAHWCCGAAPAMPPAPLSTGELRAAASLQLLHQPMIPSSSSQTSSNGFCLPCDRMA